MFPWRAAHWDFPADFDSTVTLSFLPAASADFFLGHFEATLVLREPDNSVLLEARLTPKGVRIQYEGLPPRFRALAVRWTDSLYKLEPGDTAAVRGRLKVWQGIAGARPRRPLHLGERGLTYEIRYATGVNGPTPLELESAITDILLDSAAVAPPKPPPVP